MAYSGRTSFYHIPIPITNDTLEESENIAQMQSIDNLLQAANGIVGTGVIEDGTYIGVADTGTGCKVLLNPVSGISIKGLLNGGLVQTASQIAWEGLFDETFYYLYLKYEKGLYNNTTTFSVVSETVPIDVDNLNYLFLATCNVTGGSPIIDSDPFGKVYAYGFTEHIATQKDPHSVSLIQTNAIVSESLNANLNSNKSVNLAQQSVGSTSPLITLNHAVSGNPIIKSIDEFVVEDLRTDIQISEFGELPFDNDRISIVGAINENTNDVSTNQINMATNAFNISTNTTNINNNFGGIGTNTTNIGINAGLIISNALDISQNTDDILLNSTNISGNVSLISDNTNEILNNAISISGNTDSITTNAFSVVTISGQVETNTLTLASHSSQLYNIDNRVGNLECSVFGWCSSSSSS